MATESDGIITVDEAMRRGIELHKHGLVDEAAEVYRRVLQVAPDHADALHFSGLAEHQAGRTESALARLGRAAKLAPDHPDFHNNYGNVLKLTGRLEEAEAAFRHALALRPGDPNPMNNIGTVLRARGALDEAMDMFRKVIALRPDHIEAYQNLGNCLGSLRRYDEGLDVLRQAHSLRPGAASPSRQLGAMLYSRGRIEEAAQVYREWLATDPHDAEACHLVAACTQTDVPDRAPDAFVRSLFDRYASSFDSALARLEYRAPALIAEAVDAALGPPVAALDVLDAGCGTGLCAADLRRYARSLVGVDLSAGMLERARARSLYDTLVEAEITGFLREHPNAYDLIASADTLVYFGALDSLAAALAAALRPSGALVFTVERSSESDAPAGHRLHPHGRFSHTEAHLRRALGAAGLDVAAIREVALRKETGHWVAGSLVTARRGG